MFRRGAGKRLGPVLRIALPGVAALAFAASSPRPAGAQGVALSEFLAAGGELADEDGEFPDWIEIQNQSSSLVDLEGWYLTDEAADLKKWRFPRAPVAPGGFVVVFASGKDRRTPGRELHANFQLSSEGEFLALVRPDGVSIADACAPTYPRQYDDISYGIAQAVSRVSLVAEGAAARILVPGPSAPPDWRLLEFDDAAWPLAATGVGYDAGEDVEPPEDPVNIAPLGTATQSSDYGSGQFPAALAIDGEFENFTHTAAGVNLPAAWELDLGETYAIGSVVLHNRRDCCRSRLRDVTVLILDAPGGDVVFRSALLNPENELGGGTLAGPESLAVEVAREAGGAVRGRAVRVVRTPDPDLSGTGGQGNADEADVLSLAEVEVFEGAAGFRPLIATDVEGALRDVSPSLYLRIPFDVEDLSATSRLVLRVRYDAGFAAYLNGGEVARRNASPALTWDARATAERTDAEALVPEEIDLSAQAGLLRTGRNVLAVHAMNSSASDEDFLILPELVAESIAQGQRAYFREPTPGAPNETSAIVGFVGDTKFSHDRGFYDAPFDLEIRAETPGAEIRYTLDGSAPTQARGLLYTGPIRIDRTRTVRARAFQEGLEPTNADTHTYIFVDDVARQDAAATIAAGLPATWGSVSPDYGMDPDVVGPKDIFGGVYAATIRDDLRSLPALSIVTDASYLFGPQGIYTNSTAGGIQWERPASVELIDPEGVGGFQVDCGVRIQGGYFRNHSATKKHSFRLLFKRQYGPARLRYPLFGPRAAREFDTITLRAGANDGYSWDAARLTEQYTRDEFGRSLQVATGNAGSHGAFVHLYVNGIYWGLYNPCERPDHAFSATYSGGEKEDWDALHDGAPTNGNTTAWNQMLQQATAAGSSLAGYMKLQGLDPDGTRNPAYPCLLDVPNYVDYLIVNLWGGNWDWPWKNWWAGRSRAADSTGFRFYVWDYENTMGNNRDRSPLGMNALANNFSGAGRPHELLRANPEYRLLFADRIHRYFFNRGILTPEALGARYAKLAARVERAIVGESARWGDQHYHPPLTLKEWRAERDWILNSYLPQRSAIVLGHLRSAGLYPSTEAPVFSQHGGRVAPGFALVIQAPAGEVYYTLDGTDPRLPGGGISPRAALLREPASVALVEAGAPARALVPEDDSLGREWTKPEFDDSSWTAGAASFGFETRSGYEGRFETDLREAMYGKSATVYARIPFELDPALFASGEPDFALLVLEVQYDDGYVAYLNGTRVASRNAPAAPAWNSRASAAHADSQALALEAQNLYEAAGLLRPGTNVLALHGLNSSATNDDFLLVPRLRAVPRAEGIALGSTATVKARARVGESWSALAEAAFVLDVPLRVTEVLYHPAPFEGGIFIEDEDFEFVEVQNVGRTALDLSGLRLRGGIRFDFGMGAVKTLRPGEIAVVVKDYSAFSLRYDARRILVAGEYSGNLDNLGDFFVLEGPSGETLLEVEFDPRWHPETRGGGPSLVAVDPRGDPGAWSEPSNWMPSRFPLGSPGIDESGTGPAGMQLPGDLNQDARLDLSDGIALLGYLFLGSSEGLPCGDGQFGDASNRALVDSNGDGTVNLSDAVHLLNYLFLGGAPPALGTECVPIPGCPDACR